MRKLLIAVLGLAVLVMPCRSKAQVNSVSVKVNNGQPADVIFGFQTGPNDNIDQIQINCTGGIVYVYEVQPNGFITTYPFSGVATGKCNVTHSHPGFPDDVATGTINSSITVTTVDHTVTIASSTHWTAVYHTGYHGYYWAATGGSSQITVQ